MINELKTIYNRLVTLENKVCCLNNALNSFLSEPLIVACSDQDTPITVGDKMDFYMTKDTTFTSIKISLKTPQTSGSIFTVDVKKNGVTVFTTLITIDNGMYWSALATTPEKIKSSLIFMKNDKVEIEVTQIGDGTATGLKIYFIQ